MDFKKIIADLSNGFSYPDFWLLFIQMLAASFLSFLLLKAGQAKDKKINSNILFIAVLISAGTSFVKFSAPLSLIFLGIIIWLKEIKPADNDSGILFYGTIVISFICGAGFVVPAVIVTFVFLLPILILLRNR